jgi:hypothetical protein
VQRRSYRNTPIPLKLFSLISGEELIVSFGKSCGGGRRISLRKPARLLAKIRTLQWSGSVELVDLSRTGAQLIGERLPKRDEEFFLKVESLDVFGKVAWSTATSCGIIFDEPLSASELAHLQFEAQRVRKMGISPAEKLVFDNWTTSPGR